MYGLAIKLWSSEFDKESDKFQTIDSVVYLCHDIVNKDILYLSNVIKHFVGDESLDDVFKKHVPIVKGEPIAWDEPLVKVEQQDYVSGDEDYKQFGHGWPMNDDYSDDNERIASNPKSKKLKAVKVKKPVSSENSENEDEDNEEDEDYKAQKPKKKYKKSAPKPGGKCNKCNEEFSTLNSFTEHLKHCNPDQLKELPKKEPKEPKKKGPLVQPFCCSYCTRKFSQKKALERHELLHQTDPDSKKLNSNYKYVRKEKNGPSMPNGNYQCDKCSLVFKAHATLLRHQEAHLLSESAPSLGNETNTGLKLQDIRDGAIMRCTTCDIAYNTIGMYNHHMKKFHDKALSCEECGKKFTMPNALKNHRLNFHTQFPRKCDDCGHYCISKKVFKEHIAKAHSEGVAEDTHPCEICGKVLKTKYSLKLHVKLMHEKVAGQFPCDECGKVLKTKATLEYHKRVHAGEYPFRCDQCGNGYMTEKKMMDCQNTHAGIYRFHCTHCDYKTNKDKAYRRHVSIHSDVKPYLCPLCQNHQTANPENMSGHIRKAHKMTLLQAELVAKRNRFGNVMTEEDIELAKRKLERAENAQETTRLRPDPPAGHGNVNNSYRPKKNVSVKSSPDESPNDGPATLYPPARLLYPYF